MRDVSGEDFRSISYEAQQLLKSVRASNGYSDGVDAAFYRAYFEGFSGKARSDSKILSNAALEAAYQMGVDAKNDVGTFHTVGNATISKEATAFLARAAKDLGLSITYGGKGSVANGGVVDGAVRRDVRRGYANSYRGIHIYEDAKVQEVGGKTLVGGDAAARIILGHELTHVLQNQSPAQYKEFENLVLSRTSEKSISIYMETLNKSRGDAIDEIVADYAMTRMFSDMKTAREVTKHHSKVAEAIRSALAWIREKLGIRTSEVDRAAAMWNKAYNESRRNADAAVAEAVNRAKGVANSAETSYNGVKNSIAQNNAKLIRYFTGEVRESGYVYLSDRDKAKIAHNVKSGNGWMNESTSSGYVYTDMCFYTFRYNADRSITVTEELFLEDDADRIKTIRREFASNGNKATIRRNDSTLEGKALRVGIGTEYSTSLDNRRKVGGDAEVYGQASGSGRLRTDNRSGTDSTAISETSEKQNKVKADSAESAFSVGKVKDSIATPEVDKQAKELFGKTYSWAETGYITKNGDKLDFSGKKYGARGGSRTMDHREIADAYDAAGLDIESTAALVDFMQAGNIRIMPESGGINLSVMPTKAQLDSLSDFISKNRGEVILDIDNEVGDTVVSTEYPRGTHANRVLQDIRAYFESGKTPTLSDTAAFHVQDSIAMPNADSEGNVLTEAQQEFFSGSLVTDEDGALLPVYHATDSAEFTVFDKSKLGYNTDGNTSDEGMAATAHVGFWFNTKDLTGEAGSRAEKVYLNLTNPYELTSLDALAEEIKALGEGETPAEMGEAYATDLWLRGYDGIEIRHDEEFGGTSYVAFDENQIKRTTNKSPTKDADIRYSTSLSDYARIVSDRIDAAARGRQTSVSEVLRRNEKEARDVKREILPDMKTVGEVARFYLDRTMRSMLYCVRMTISENGGGSDERNATGAQSVCQQRHKQALLYL